MSTEKALMLMVGLKWLWDAMQSLHRREHDNGVNIPIRERNIRTKSRKKIVPRFLCWLPYYFHIILFCSSASSVFTHGFFHQSITMIDVLQ